MEWPTFLDAMDGTKLPLFMLGWSADYPDADDFAFPLMHSSGRFPLCQNYKNPEADKLVEAGVAETDPAKRKAIYAKLQALEFEEAPHFLPVDTTRYRTQRTWVKGWYHNPVFPDSPWSSYYYPMYKSESK